MQKNLDILVKCPVFENIAPGDLSAMLKCLNADTRQYQKDAVILLSGQTTRRVGVVLSGSVHIIKEDALGNRSIVSECRPADLFAEAVACSDSQISPVTVVAAGPAQVLFIGLPKILSFCEKNCAFHTRLVQNMLRILANKNMRLNQKLDYLSLRTTREKITAYLLAQYQQQNRNPIKIPFNRNELADYLCVNRSALSRELSHMREEGLLDFHKDVFRLSMGMME